MKKRYVILALGLIFAACSDGHHMRPPIPMPSENPITVSLECVSVVNYKQIDPSTLSEKTEGLVEGDFTQPAATGGATGGVTGGVTGGGLSPKEMVIPPTNILPLLVPVIDTVGGILNGAGSTSGTPTKAEIQACIKKELDKAAACGSACSIYWGGGTWLVSKTGFQSKPQYSEVSVVPFKGCEQIQKATCLLTNYE